MSLLTPSQERRHLQLLGLAGFASMASMRIGDPMLVVLGEEFQVSTGEASGVVSVFAVVYGLMQLFYGPLGERFGKLRVVSLAVAACALFSTITALSVNLPMLLVMRGLMGAAAAGIIPLSMAWVGDQVPYERRQETLAKLMSATVIGMMSGLWFGGFAADTLGWRSAFVLLAAMFAWPALLLWRERQKSSAPASSQAPNIVDSFRLTGQLLLMPRVRWVMGVTATEGALVIGALAFMPTHLHQQYGLSVVAAGSVMMLYGVGGLLYSQMARRWLAWLGERGLVRTGAALVAIGNSICGNSAIAALAPVIGAEKKDVASAIGLTAVIGVLLVLGLPMLIAPFMLSNYQYGVLAGMSVYAVPQVVAAAFPVSELSGNVATLVNLTRVLLLGPAV